MKNLISCLMVIYFFVFFVGTVSAEYTVSDNFHGENTCTATAFDPDTTPPEVTVGDMIEIRPPNHKYHSFNLSDLVVIAEDDCAGSLEPDVFGTIIFIYSDEPEDAMGNGDGKTHDDIVITGPSHPEYGTAVTDDNGRFIIPVEGGGTVTVSYKKEGMLTAHRKVHVPWNDIAVCETVTMIVRDSAFTTIEFNGNPDKVVTHNSTEVADEFGSRSCSMVFTGDNKAYLVDEEGNDVQELSTITTRATEYSPPESMPARLPPNSAYTYCVELGVDGAQRVRFEKPVITWVDNFLGFDVGEIVPVGYYDLDRGVWVPSENGVVVMLLDTDMDGVVDALDSDGDGQPDDLDDDGSFTDEAAGLDDPDRYAPSSTFWRVAVTHFTPWDYNWPYGPPLNAIHPNPKGEPDADQQKTVFDDAKRCASSYVEERSRIFHEDIPIPGTDMTLHYASNRVEGYRTYITVPASGDSVPDSLKKIIVQLNVAGRILKQDLAPLPNQKAEFVWDGLDLLGRRVNGPTTAHVSVGFVYDAVYYSVWVEWAQAFAQAGDDVTGILARRQIILWKHKINDVYIPPRVGNGTLAKGWALFTHHHMNPVDSSILFKGDGEKIKNSNGIITTVAGNGTDAYSGDGGPALEAQFISPHSLAMDSGGNLYISDYKNHRIRKVDPDGIITTVAGDGTRGYGGDGGPATEAQFTWSNGLALDSNGNIYITDFWNYRVRKIHQRYDFDKTVGEDDIQAVDTNGLGYIMSPIGLHKKTIDLNSGVILLEFGYDTDNNLTDIIDRYGMMWFNKNGHLVKSDVNNSLYKKRGNQCQAKNVKLTLDGIGHNFGQLFVDLASTGTGL